MNVKYFKVIWLAARDCLCSCSDLGLRHVPVSLSLCNRETGVGRRTATTPPGTSSFIRRLFVTLIKFTLGLTTLQAVPLSSAQIFLQQSDVSGLACWVTVSCAPLPLPDSHNWSCQIILQQAGGGSCPLLYEDLFSCPFNSFKCDPKNLVSAGSVT